MIEIKVIGMKCEHCKNRVEKALKELEGVNKVKVDLPSCIVKIKSNNTPLDIIEKKIEEAGYKIEK